MINKLKLAEQISDIDGDDGNDLKKINEQKKIQVPLLIILIQVTQASIN